MTERENFQIPVDDYDQSSDRLAELWRQLPAYLKEQLEFASTEAWNDQIPSHESPFIPDDIILNTEADEAMRKAQETFKEDWKQKKLEDLTTETKLQYNLIKALIAYVTWKEKI